MLNGSLSDFYSISLNDSDNQFEWHEVISKGKINPGPRSKHDMFGGKQNIYLVGGLQSNTQASNDIYEFDPVK
jgi:hypothetical protein